MAHTIDFCSNCDCGIKRIIVNKFHYLCQQKNILRLHPEGSPIQPIKSNSLNMVSEREVVTKQTYSKVIQHKKESEDLVCKGCGQSQYLSPSHLISRSKRKDLEAHPENIHWHCMHRIQADEFGHEGCHDRYESSNWKKLMTLKDLPIIMMAVMKLDREKYEFLLSLKQAYLETEH